MSKATESKASPLGRDVKAIVLTNVIALVSLLAFAALGLSIVSAATGESMILSV
ncbi:hypothetical protein FHX37_2334 [Haloactinospora alba]|uniref:Uncharacterized protein n=1 Tax=Haloactinospora alba TaxID=405555 RepID=A0A543NKR0_9ACTN|nr:hypothetical protein [Haloactinospora alba]TQN32377.1 hypothetical protein FHX37_2334 [Haloactinospora alba]